MHVGLLEGEPVSPTLFNLFIDTLFDRLNRLLPEVSLIPANGFADDVLVIAFTSAGLNLMLHECSQWASEYCIQWSPDKSKVLTRDPTTTRFELAGEELEQVRKADYLGITIGANGLSPDKYNDRIKAARDRVRELRACGLLNARSHMWRTRQNYCVLIRPMYEYALAIVEPTSEQLRKMEKLQEAAGIPLRLKNQRPKRRAFALLGLQIPEVRRASALSKLTGRLL